MDVTTWIPIDYPYNTAHEALDRNIATMGADLGPVYHRLWNEVAWLLWEDTLLHLARLTDRAETHGKPNLTINRLAGPVDDALRDDVTALVETAVEKATFARDWRNRHIAHRDLRLALQDRAEPLEPGSRLKVKEALVAVAAVLRRIAQHYEDSDIFFEYLGDAGDAEALLYVIRDGLEADARRRKRLTEGKIEPEDFTHRPI